MVEDPLSELRGDLRHCRELRDRGFANPAGRAESLQQARANRWPDAGDRVEYRLDRALRPEFLVVRDRESVSLVPDPLQGMQRRRGRIEHQRMEALGLIDLLGLLGEPDGRDIVQA